MPIYEYHCEDCNQDFECIVFGNEEPDCPSCKSTNICRLMSAFGFVSKGSDGQTVSSSASACSGCASSNCSSCGH